MNKPGVLTMGSGGGGLFSSSSSASFSKCSTHISNGAGTSEASLSYVKCDCVKCTYCLSSLGNVSIKCSECVNFHLCLKCFSMSAEIGEHKKDHNYFLKSSVNFPLFDSEKLWTYKEELHLLQFIEQYGFDNWDEIGKHLPNRTAEECMQHYHSYYIYGNLGKNTFTSNLKNKFESLVLKGTSQKSASPISPASDLDLKTEDGLVNKSEMTTTVLLPPIEMSIEEQRALGYMPLRDDFEREYKNDGEQLLSNLNIANNQLVLMNNDLYLNNLSNGQVAVSSSSSAGGAAKQESATNLDLDDVVDFDLKLTLIQMYRECLIERQRFKKIAREYGLVNNASGLLNKQKTALQQGSGVLLAPNGLSFNHVSNKKRIKKTGVNIVDDKEMSELNEKLKKYAQFMSVSDYETLIENLRHQRQICKKIKELQTYRTHYGLTKFTDIEVLKKEQIANTPQVKTRKRKRKSYQMHGESPNKRLTRRQNNSSHYNSMLGKLETTLNDTNLTDLNISNIRNFSPTSSTSSSRSSSCNRSQHINSRSNSTNSMNMYELPDNPKPSCPDDLISEDQDEDRLENDENNQMFTDEDENEISEDLSSGGAASSGGSGINEPNNGLINNFGRRLRQLNNRKNSSLLTKNKKNKKINLSLNTTSSSKKLNTSLSKSGLKRTSFLLKSAKKNGVITNNNKIMSKKLKLLDLQRNGRSERLCSMPGYNLLSENEKKLISSLCLKPSDYINFKTNLIKNSLARRKQKSDKVNSTPNPKHTTPSSTSNLNETCPSISNQPNALKTPSMMLRRHSSNSIVLPNEDTPMSASEALGNSFLGTAESLAGAATPKSFNSPASTKCYENNKFMTILMKTTCPTYFQIPNSSRKRILRFLCDNGWIDVS